jgi:hypothetical protein
MNSAQHKAAILTLAARAVEWDVRVEVATPQGIQTIPVRHPNRIEADGVRERPGGLLGVVWFAWMLIRRLTVGADTTNRAMERRMRRAVLGAFDPGYRPHIERLGMLDIMQLHEAIGIAQRDAVMKAGEAMRRVMEQRSEDEDASGNGLNPSPRPSLSGSQVGGEGARTGPVVRQNADGSRTTLFPLVPGQPIPGELTGGKKVVFGVPLDASQPGGLADGQDARPTIEQRPSVEQRPIMTGNPRTAEGCG